MDNEKILVFGRSLGGALAHTSQTSIAGLIVENTFTCVAEVAGVALFVLRLLPTHILQRLVTSKWMSRSKIGQLELPILFLSGLKDAIIPPPQMAELFALCGPEKIVEDEADSSTKAGERSERAKSATGFTLLFRSFAEGGHNDTPLRQSEEYITALRSLLEVIAKRHLSK